VSDLIAFLNARLAEDEAAANAATPGPWAWEPTGDKDSSWAVGLVQDEDGSDLSGRLEPGQGVVIDGVCESINGHIPDADHIARHDPARALREVAFKRDMVRRCAPHMNELDVYPNGLVSPRAVLSRQFLVGLAAVYSTHPDYRQQWAS